MKRAGGARSLFRSVSVNDACSDRVGALIPLPSFDFQAGLFPIHVSYSSLHCPLSVAHAPLSSPFDSIGFLRL